MQIMNKNISHHTAKVTEVNKPKLLTEIVFEEGTKLTVEKPDGKNKLGDCVITVHGKLKTKYHFSHKVNAEVHDNKIKLWDGTTK